MLGLVLALSARGLDHGARGELLLLPRPRARHHRDPRPRPRPGRPARRHEGVFRQLERLLDLVDFLLGKILITYRVDVIVSQVNSIKDFGKDWVRQKIIKFTGSIWVVPKRADQ